MASSPTYPLYSFQFWKCYFIQMRPYLLFISGIAGATGMAMSPGPSPDWKTYIGFIPFFTGYGFGQALTDCFQTDTDKLSAPYRPLSKGIVSVRSVLIVSITGLLASGMVFYLLNPVAFWLSLLVVVGLATYSYVKKNSWVAAPFYNAWIVALLPVMGYYSLTELSFDDFPKHLVPFFLVTFFSYASFVLIGYLKDIGADKETGYKTMPVLFGWDKTIIAGDLVAIATIVLFWTSTTRINIWSTGAGVMGSIIILSGQLIAHITKNKSEQGALFPILTTVRSFVLLHIAIILQFHSALWPYGLLYYGLFEWALYLRPSKYQV